MAAHADLAVGALGLDVVGARAVGAEHDGADAALARVRSSTTAPAPSANTAAVARSRGSVIRDMKSAPMTTAQRERPASTWAAPMASAERKPVHAEPTSNAPAPVAPRACATSGAVPGMISSEVVVATITRSTSEAGMPAQASAARRIGGVGLQALVRARHPARVDAGTPGDPVVVDAEAGADLGVGDDRIGDAHGDRRGQGTDAPGQRGGRASSDSRGRVVDMSHTLWTATPGIQRHCGNTRQPGGSPQIHTGNGCSAASATRRSPGARGGRRPASDARGYTRRPAPAC